MTAAPHQAEEESDVSTHGEDTAKTTDAPDERAKDKDGAAEDEVTAEPATDKPAAEPKVRTAAEIVAAAKEKAAKEEADPTKKTPAPQPAVTKPVAAKPAAPTVEKSRSKVALSAVGSGVTRVRNYAATIVWLVAVLCAAVLALGALFTVLDQANENNDIVSWVLDRGHDLVGPFEDVFKLETAKNTLLVNWGIAALAYLVVGKLLERIIRP